MCVDFDVQGSIAVMMSGGFCCHCQTLTGCKFYFTSSPSGKTLLFTSSVYICVKFFSV